MLEAINLDCVRGERRLFHNLNFQLKAGECLLVRGENGSGKTSLLRMLVGLTPPAAGAIDWRSSPIKKLGDEYRRELLYCGHPLGLKDDLSATENLIFSMALTDELVTQDAVYEALGKAGLQGREHLSVRALSQGQKRRVNLARLLLQKRALWVLDEPLTALDTQASLWVVRVIDQHLSNGGIAVLTTHQDLTLAGATHVIRVGV
ncbi:MAG: cytochrome c biogenesis heme-transporting ATPase CcmA [Limnobacter sp.]|uniref:cytochrome c biogenesis heme-transporting ATPase CcmA n=1 Tax=unclassified Limnobacter TaxID=2630203 RepID=UPI000C5694D1|nr:cytochrome c biogenesis heme-transporting ATPase CcmA [Limnobacter sp. UBA3528]MAZ10264.1 heme ABC transporter ATP-binding protein CcmA [Sutterellaceae bacterium]MDZ4057067.1 cytochrome c biogenesis heme-transporting ATPase CcmA [Polynucleobacter sp.]